MVEYLATTETLRTVLRVLEYGGVHCVPNYLTIQGRSNSKENTVVASHSPFFYTVKKQKKEKRFESFEGNPQQRPRGFIIK
jgi:hypothetical protein